MRVLGSLEMCLNQTPCCMMWFCMSYKVQHFIFSPSTPHCVFQKVVFFFFYQILAIVVFVHGATSTKVICFSTSRAANEPHFYFAFPPPAPVCPISFQRKLQAAAAAV